MNDPLIFERAIHFAATIMAAGTVFFVAFVAEPALRKAANDTLALTLFARLRWIAWFCFAFALVSGAAWFVLTAASMSGQPVADVYAQDVLWTVLSETDFGNDWLVRLILACGLAGVSVAFISAQGVKSARLKAAAVILAAAFAGSLAWAGHAIGGQGIEGLIHPIADILHLIAAAVWVGALVPLALLLAMTGQDADTHAVARTATLRFSTLGIVSVATILLTGIINTWYLSGSIDALTETQYGHLLLIKIALFFAMVGVAAFNRLRLTPRLVENPLVENPDAAAARNARRQLGRNAVIEAAMGAAIIAIVAALGTLPPGSHAHHHESEGPIPPDASFQHIHGIDGMADVMIEPGHVGTANATIHLLNDDLETLAALDVTLTLTAPVPGSKPTTRVATKDSDGVWHVDGIQLPESGNWTVSVGAVLGPNKRLDLTAPIVIDAK
ncbi:MAG: copper homeostasis membrane protein CopD [Xanthobacteraceae bacterium]